MCGNRRGCGAAVFIDPAGLVGSGGSGDRTVSSRGVMGSGWGEVTPNMAGRPWQQVVGHGRDAALHAVHSQGHFRDGSGGGWGPAIAHAQHARHAWHPPPLHPHSQPHFRDTYPTLRSRVTPPSVVSSGSSCNITPPATNPYHNLRTLSPLQSATPPRTVGGPPPAARLAAFTGRRLALLALLAAVALAALLWVDRGPTWAPCWAREALWGVFYDHPSAHVKRGLRALGFSRCDVYDDIAFTEGELIRVLAHAYAKHGQDGLPGDVLAKETKRVLYHTEEGAARRYVPHLPLRMHFIVLDEAIARSDYLTAARAQTFVGMFPAPSLVSFAARHFDGETRALLFWRLCWSGLCWAVVAAGVLVVVAVRVVRRVA